MADFKSEQVAGFKSESPADFSSEWVAGLRRNQHLLALTRRSRAKRHDLIAGGFAALGCTSEDSEVVEVLLHAVEKSTRFASPEDILLTQFSSDPRVVEYASQTLNRRQPPLATLARVYENNKNIREGILAYANALPVALRGDIAEAAAVESIGRPAFQHVLESYDLEVDDELIVSASIYYHRSVSRTPGASSEKHLTDLAVC